MTAPPPDPAPKKRKLLLVNAQAAALRPVENKPAVMAVRAKDRKLQAQSAMLAAQQGLPILQQASLKERKRS